MSHEEADTYLPGHIQTHGLDGGVVSTSRPAGKFDGIQDMVCNHPGRCERTSPAERSNRIRGSPGYGRTHPGYGVPLQDDGDVVASGSRVAPCCA